MAWESWMFLKAAWTAAFVLNSAAESPRPQQIRVVAVASSGTFGALEFWLCVGFRGVSCTSWP